MSFPAWTDDPVSDAQAYSEYLDERAKDLPECDECGERIMDDHYVKYMDIILCPDCILKNTRWV